MRLFFLYYLSWIFLLSQLLLSLQNGQVVSAFTTTTLKPSTTTPRATRSLVARLRYQNGRYKNDIDDDDNTSDNNNKETTTTTTTTIADPPSKKWYKNLRNFRIRIRRRRQQVGGGSGEQQQEDNKSTIDNNDDALDDDDSTIEATATTRTSSTTAVVARNLTELRQAVLIDKIPLKEIDCRFDDSQEEDEEEESSTKPITTNATTILSSPQLIRNHPVLQILEQRHSTNSTPGNRHQADTAHVALSIEGGGMRGAVSAGMAAAIAALGLTDSFDSVYGSSAGCIVGAYMISRQMCVDVYTQVLPAAKSRFASKRRVMSNVGAGLVSEWMDSITFSSSSSNTTTTTSSTPSTTKIETETTETTKTDTIKERANNGSSRRSSSSSSSLRDRSSNLARKFQRLPTTLVQTIKPYLNSLSPGMNISFVLDGVMSKQHGLRPFDMESFQRNDAKQPLYAVSSTVRNGKLETVAFSSRDGDYFDREIVLVPPPPRPKQQNETATTSGNATLSNNVSFQMPNQRRRRIVRVWRFLKTAIIKIPVAVYQTSKKAWYSNNNKKTLSLTSSNETTTTTGAGAAVAKAENPQRRFAIVIRIWRSIQTTTIRVIKIPLLVYQSSKALYSNNNKFKQESSSLASSNETTTDTAAAAASEAEQPSTKVVQEKKKKRITAAMSPLFRKTRNLPNNIKKRLKESSSPSIFKIVQPFRKTTNGTLVQLQEASACPENSGKKGFFACIESSMLVPGAAGAPVKLLRSKFRQQAAVAEEKEEEEAAAAAAATTASPQKEEEERNNPSAAVLERYTNTCFDAFCYEPIPYRSAVENGATHVLALRSRPDGCVVETVPKVYETLVAPLYFRRHGLPQVVDFFERGGSQYRYLEDVLTLDEGLVVGCTTNAGDDDDDDDDDDDTVVGGGQPQGGQQKSEERDHGIRVPPTEILFGTESDEELEVDINSWKRAHLLPLILPAGTPELPTLTQDKDEVLEAVRNGFAAAFDVLAPIAGLDFDPSTVYSKKIAELMFPRNDDDDDIYVLETPVNVKGDYIQTKNNNEDDDVDINVEKKARRRFVDWIQRKRKERRTARWIGRWNPFRAVAVEVERESPDTKQYVKADSLDWLEAEALLAMLPGFQDGRLSHLAGGLRTVDDQDASDVREEEAMPTEESYKGC